jgi:hypothetical protein
MRFKTFFVFDKVIVIANVQDFNVISNLNSHIGILENIFDGNDLTLMVFDNLSNIIWVLSY